MKILLVLLFSLLSATAFANDTETAAPAVRFDVDGLLRFRVQVVNDCTRGPCPPIKVVFRVYAVQLRGQTAHPPAILLYEGPFTTPGVWPTEATLLGVDVYENDWVRIKGTYNQKTDTVESISYFEVLD
jgi:hypothetical protein